ncbi:hypothetical protein H4R19_003285, partial [Coemansia spiralis]
MPDTPEQRPARGRSIVRGRGGSAGGALPSGRLSSLRGGSVASSGAASASSSGTASVSSSATGARDGAPKMKFAPKIPARRVKREPTDAPPTATPATPATAGPKKEPRAQQQQPMQKPRRRMELIQRVTGPFAQGPASLAGRGGARGGVGSLHYSAGGDSARAAATAHGGGADDADGWAADALEALEVTDYNERARDGGVDVQTEETALRELAEARWARLDCGAGAALGVGQGGSGSSDGRLVVLQIPRVPALELGREAQERHQARAAEAVMDVDVGAEVADVKPDIAQL